MDYGYMRVSSTDQNEDRQLFALEAKGVDKDHLFLDKQSGKNFDRPAYQAMLERLSPGDLLYVTSIDRLGRSYEEVQEQWRFLTREKQIDICVLDMPLLDTRRDKNLLGTFIADLVLQVLSFVAQQERDNIRKRQAEGIAAAKERGVTFGRAKTIELPPNFDIVFQLWDCGSISGKEAARCCHLARSTWRYYAAKRKDELEAEQIARKK